MIPKTRFVRAAWTYLCSAGLPRTGLPPQLLCN